MKKVLLYSMGMDSWLIDKLWKPDIKLFIRIGTRSNELEYKKLQELLKEDKIEGKVKILEYPLGIFEKPNYYLPLRNLHFVVLAAHYGNLICLGSVKYSVHYDNTSEFANQCSNLLSSLISEESTDLIKVTVPYENVSKTELLKMYLDTGGDINEAYLNTISCYNPIDNHPCMNCVSCIDKFTAFYNNGYKFSTEEINKFILFVSNNYETQKKDVKELFSKLKGD